MKKLILVSAAAALLTGSLANAQFLLGQDENGKKQVANFAAGQTEMQQRRAARISRGSVMAPSGAFLLFTDGNDNKRVVNTYAAPRRLPARIPGAGVSTSTTTAGIVSPGFLLNEDGDGHKVVENQYAR